MSDSPSPARLHIGAAWQPELWPDDQWVDEIARMREVGINCVRLFNFAWHRFEPREWEFDFEWATRVLDLLRDSQIDVIAATPTARPPAWLAARYPEIVRVTPDGRRVPHGRGRRYSVVSPRYREFCVRVVDQMVHAFRGHEAIVGWQVDHQMHGADYSNEARRAFHAWLYDRFGHVDALNKTWGLEFGSQAYEYFEQVPTPPIDDLRCGAAGHHPSLAIAYRRFTNDQWSSFIQVQVEMIRNGFDKPTSTNAPPNWGMNAFRQNQLLDRAGMAIRPAPTSSNAHGTRSLGSANESARLADTLMHFDRMRGEKPGVPYWHFDAPTEDKDAVPLAWLSVFAGGEMLVLDQWRQPWAGQEIGRTGVVSPTGRYLANRAAFADLARQLKEQAAYLRAHPPVEARIGVVVSSESAWAFAAEPPEPGFDYEQVWRDEFYLPIARAHYWRDVIDQSADFCPYYVLVAPLLPMVYRPTKERLREWVNDGGCLLLGPLTGHRTEEYTAWTDDELGGLEQLIGATCAGSFRTQEEDEPVSIAWSAPPGEEPPAEAGSPGEVPTSTPRGLCQGFTPTTAHALARYANGPAAGQAAILMHKLGQGTVITLGGRVDPDTYLDLIHTLCDLAKVEPLAAGSPDVAVLPRMNPDASVAAYGLVNLTANPQTITLPKPGPDRLTGREIDTEVTLAPREAMLVQVTPIVEPIPTPAAPASEPSTSVTGDANPTGERPAPADASPPEPATAVVADAAPQPDAERAEQSQP